MTKRKVLIKKFKLQELTSHEHHFYREFLHYCSVCIMNYLPSSASPARRLFICVVGGGLRIENGTKPSCTEGS